MINLDDWNFGKGVYPHKYNKIFINRRFGVWIGYYNTREYNYATINNETKRIEFAEFDLREVFLYKEIKTVIIRHKIQFTPIEELIQTEKSIGEIIINELFSKNFIEV